MKIVLRDYQKEMVEIGVEFFKIKGIKPSIIVAPTAAGKSIVIAEIARRIGEKVLVLQPSKELLEQNYEKFTRLGGEASIYSASFGEKEIGDVTYATIGSIVNVAYKFKELGITKVILDECDRYPRKKSGMLRRFIDGSKAKHVLGLTATPLKLQTNMGEAGPYSKLVMLTNRSKEGMFFRHILHVSQIQEMVDLGYWTPLKYQAYDFDNGELVYNSSGSDFTKKSMEKAYKNQDIHTKIARKCAELTDRRSILVAVPTIQQAKDLAGEIPNSAVVHSKTPKKERKRIIDQFKSGSIRVVIQVSVLCLDTKTEILTKSGWVKYSEMTYNHEVANWDNGNIFYKNPKNIVIRKVRPDEKMYSFNSNSIDFRVTGNHEMITKTKLSGKYKKEKAKNLLSKKRIVPIHGNYTPEYFEIPQEKINTTYNKRINANTYALKSEFPNHSISERKKIAKDRLNERLNLKYKNPYELTNDECKLIGFWIGDGTFSKQYSMCQSLVYPKIIENIGYSYSRAISNNNSIRWTLNTGRGFGSQKVNGFYSILPYLNKNGKYLEYFTKEQLKSFLYGFWLADGNHNKSGAYEDVREKYIFNTNKQLLDKIQSICVTRGIKCFIRKESSPRKEGHSQLYKLGYDLNANSSIINRYNSRFSVVEETPKTDELVWCVTTDSENIITRRNGRVLVTGNSIGFDYPELDCLITGRPTSSISWWYQFVGRATRIHPDKEDALIVDFAGSFERFGKVEELYYKETKNGNWELFGSDKKLLTGIPMHEIGFHLEGGKDISKKIDENGDEEIVFMTFGKYKGKPVKSMPPQYQNWLMENINWKPHNMKIKKEIERLRKIRL